LVREELERLGGAMDPAGRGGKIMLKPKPAQDAKTGRFLTGNVGGGRPKGSRGLLAEIFLDDLYQDWKEHGAQAIREVRETRPADYLRVVAMVVSKYETLDTDDTLRDAAMEQFIEERRQQALAMIAKMDEADDA
jgi:hypothetical protein